MHVHAHVHVHVHAHVHVHVHCSIHNKHMHVQQFSTNQRQQKDLIMDTQKVSPGESRHEGTAHGRKFSPVQVFVTDLEALQEKSLLHLLLFHNDQKYTFTCV